MEQEISTTASVTPERERCSRCDQPIAASSLDPDTYCRSGLNFECQNAPVDWRTTAKTLLKLNADLHDELRDQTITLREVAEHLAQRDAADEARQLEPAVSVEIEKPIPPEVVNAIAACARTIDRIDPGEPNAAVVREWLVAEKLI